MINVNRQNKTIKEKTHMYLKSNERNAAPQHKFLKFLYIGSLGKWECFDVIWPCNEKIAEENVLV
jgi:hypothetical protein